MNTSCKMSSILLPKTPYDSLLPQNSATTLFSKCSNSIPTITKTNRLISGNHHCKSLSFPKSKNLSINCVNVHTQSECVKSDALTTQEFLVVNFYYLVQIEDPEHEVAKHRSFLQDLNIHGRIYISHQGINAQYSASQLDALTYVNWVKEDVRFKDMLVQMSPTYEHAFPRLRLQQKSSLVQIEGGTSHLSITNASARAVPLTPNEWKKKLSEAITTNQGAIDSENLTGRKKKENAVLLDVRNGYEWDIGHFQGAKRPVVDCFRKTAFGIPDSKEEGVDPLANADKENTEILMYCTGGIRCDIYSAILRNNGFKKLYALKGGISHYLKEEGSFQWMGNLFVFDTRLSVAPRVYNPKCTQNMQHSAISFAKMVGNEEYLSAILNNFGRCDLCGSPVHKLCHRNCANVDCNQLILSCQECSYKLKGCCSSVCTNASRLRPFLTTEKRYDRWHMYRDSDRIC